MDSIKEKVIIMNQQHAASLPPSSSSATHKRINDMGSINYWNRQPTSSSSSMVGFDAYLGQLLYQLTGHPFSRKILSIVGMGGIGKTTLARNVYENSLIVHHFYVRAWITVSQQFNAREIILQALSCLGVSTSSKTDGELGLELSRSLYGLRYLIVFDDVWSVEAWDKIKFSFPDNKNGSRIVVTTRLSHLIDDFGSSAIILDFLDDKNSWHLFCEKTFAKKSCPPELEETAKRIVRKCKGLPLAIIVIGGLLGKSPSTQEYWENIVKDKDLTLNSGDGYTPFNILYLSYKHLPVWLKSCFLYFGRIPENHRINVSQLVRFWIAEGFIKPNRYQSLEEIAENYIKELVDRNLVLVGELRRNKKFGTCYLHDLVRDLCMRIAEKENYFWVQRSIDGKRHFIVDEITATRYLGNSHISRTSIYHPMLIHGYTGALKSRSQRVLFTDSIEDASPEVNLRFLHRRSALYVSANEITPYISLHWNLQTLILLQHSTVWAPSEIWRMPQLRHIEIVPIYLSDPPSRDGGIVLQNLQTLRLVVNLIFTEEVCKRIPNIKDLHICFDSNKWGCCKPCYSLHNVALLNKLESLVWKNTCPSSQKLKLPSGLKELSLDNCKLDWSDMAMIGSLPHLQILKLLDNAVVGEEWNCVEGEFLCLKHLVISRCNDLIKWNIEDTSSFPVLETLCLMSLSTLDEVPPCVGGIPTLEEIEMYYCSESASISAVKILEEQESFGNEDLHLRLQCFEGTGAKIQELGITCKNLHIS